MKPQVFIDGGAGTTGLRIRDRLLQRADISLIELPESLRKNPAARKDALNSATVAILCLPDTTAREAAAAVTNPNTAIIDASSAHRVTPGWTYGLPELHGQREAIAASKRITNPGCHASGFIALITPLVSAGILPSSSTLSCLSLTGYSGGGKQMITQYETPVNQRDPLLAAPRAYGLAQNHKHIPEMMAISGLSTQPAFVPVVADFYSGMEVTVALPAGAVKATSADIIQLYSEYYADEPMMHVAPKNREAGFLSAATFTGRDDMEISVHGGSTADAPLTLVARFDNLGKGASGAAIQNLNILLGAKETEGLIHN